MAKVGEWVRNRLTGSYGWVTSITASGRLGCQEFSDDGDYRGESILGPGHWERVEAVPAAVYDARKSRFVTPDGFANGHFGGTGFAHSSTTQSGKHFDEGKPRLDLVDTYAIEQLGHVLAFGAKKYGEHNWRGGILYLKLLGSALRHLFAFASGIDNDHESGLPHLAHAMCCCMMLLGTTKLHPEMDNRYKGQN